MFFIKNINPILKREPSPIWTGEMNGATHVSHWSIDMLSLNDILQEASLTQSKRGCLTMVTTNRRKKAEAPALPLNPFKGFYYYITGGQKVDPKIVPPEEWIMVINDLLSMIKPYAQYLGDFFEIGSKVKGDWPENAPDGFVPKTRVWNAAYINNQINQGTIRENAELLLTTKMEFVRWDYQELCIHDGGITIFGSTFTAVDEETLKALFTDQPTMPTRIISHFRLIFFNTLFDLDKRALNLRRLETMIKEMAERIAYPS